MKKQRIFLWVIVLLSLGLCVCAFVLSKLKDQSVPVPVQPTARVVEPSSETVAETEPTTEEVTKTESETESETEETTTVEASTEESVQHARRIWVGDSRTEGMKNSVEASDTDFFIAKSGATYDWFVAEAVPVLEAQLQENADAFVLINMGVNDCFAAKRQQDLHKTNIFMAPEYVTAINALVDKYPSSTFVFYAVNPCDGERSFINPEIMRFNGVISKTCQASYLDTYAAMLSDGFATVDGLHYDAPTYQVLYSSIINSLAGIE